MNEAQAAVRLTGGAGTTSIDVDVPVGAGMGAAPESLGGRALGAGSTGEVTGVGEDSGAGEEGVAGAGGMTRENPDRSMPMSAGEGGESEKPDSVTSKAAGDDCDAGAVIGMSAGGRITAPSGGGSAGRA